MGKKLSRIIFICLFAILLISGQIYYMQGHLLNVRTGQDEVSVTDLTLSDGFVQLESEKNISPSDVSTTDISETVISETVISDTVISDTDVSVISTTDISESDVTETVEEDEEPPVFLIESEKQIYCKDERNIKTLYGEAVSYRSSDKNIASVDSAGRIYTNKAGECTITAKDANGNISECKVTVIKVCYLTIDDWPNENTDSILKILDEYDIPATFFVCAGKESRPYYQRIVDEGHVLANHTSSHKSTKIYASKENFYDSVIGLKNYVIKYSDIESMPKILRFPGGSNGYNYEHNGTAITEYMVKKGYHVFDWTAEFRDTRSGATAETCFAAVKNQCKDDREILLLHNKSHSAEALPKVIEYLLDQGYTFAPITMNTKPYNFKKVY